jgi:hypothetical protein
MSPSSFFKVFLLYKEHYMIYIITEKAQITLSYMFVNKEMFNKYTSPIFKQNVGFKVECLPPL